MRCTQPDADLQALLDGELGPSQTLEIQQHVADCTSCQSRLQFFHEIHGELRAHHAFYNAAQTFGEQLSSRLRRLARRRRFLRIAAVVLLALTPLIGLRAIDWFYTDQKVPPLLAEIATVHAALVRDDLLLDFPTVDADRARRWLEQRRPFRPVLPQTGWGGLYLFGASSLSLSDQEAAFLMFGQGDRRGSLANFPDLSQSPGSGKSIAMDEITF